MDPNSPKYTFEQLRFYHTRYVREYRAICVLWGILTIIWCILNIVSFIQPHWIGDTPSLDSKYGHIGVYKYCEPFYEDKEFMKDGRYTCRGNFGDFATILNDSLRATTFFVGVSALLMLISIASMLLFFCFKRRWIFYLCGTLEIISAVFMFIGCIIFPNGWTGNFISTLCGPEVGRYSLGACGIRWAYILAIIGIVDAAILAVLAFVLASKSARIEHYIQNNDTGTITKSAFNGYAGDTLSKHSIPIQPVMMMPADTDRYSDYSQSHKSMKSRPAGASNFHL